MGGRGRDAVAINSRRGSAMVSAERRFFLFSFYVFLNFPSFFGFDEEGGRGSGRCETGGDRMRTEGAEARSSGKAGRWCRLGIDGFDN